jgi:carotenoid 1,2-hydratase
VIGFIGSVFSPYYRWAGRRHPLNHSAINIGLYGRGTRWAMTERGAGAVEQSAERFAVGPSAMRWTGDMLVIDVDEIAVPHMLRIRGQIRVHPEAVTAVEVPLDGEGHVWRPFAPVSRIEVDLVNPGWKWNGHGYLDGNFGSRALEADFRYWTWARLPTRAGAATFYDAERRDGTHLEVALGFGADGTVRAIEAPPRTPLPRTFWQVRRETRADHGHPPRQVKAMLDTPFYSRSMVRTRIGGEETVGVHEALDLDRFANPLLKFLLPVRMPRRARWPGRG